MLLHPEETEVKEHHIDCDQERADHDIADHGWPRTSVSPMTSSGTPSPLMSAITWKDPRLASRDPVPVDGTTPRLAGVTPPIWVTAWMALPTSTSPAPAVGHL